MRGNAIGLLDRVWMGTASGLKSAPKKLPPPLVPQIFDAYTESSLSLGGPILRRSRVNVRRRRTIALAAIGSVVILVGGLLFVVMIARTGIAAAQA